MEPIDPLWSADEVQKLLHLAEAQARLLREVLDTLPYAVGILDNDMALLSHNRAFSRILELNKLDLRLFSALTKDASRSRRLTEKIETPNRPVKSTIAAGSGELELEMIRLPGALGRIIVTVTSAGVEGPEHRINGSAPVWFRNLPTGIYVYDAHRIFAFANSLFADMSGFTPSELAGMKVDELISPFPEAATSQFGERTIIRRCAHLTTKDGAVLEVETTETVIQDDPEAFTICTVRILEAGRDCAPEDRVMDALERMSGEIAHRLNNLLTVVISYADLVASKFGSIESLSREVGLISDAANNAAELTSQLLTFSRGRAGKVEVFNVNRAIRDAQPLLRRSVNKDTSLSFFFADDAANVEMNPKDFETILVNLVTNASESLAGPGEVSIETFAGEPERYNPQVVHQFNSGSEAMQTFAVRDSGSGIADPLIHQIFEPFCTTKTGKAGLGLSEVYGIVKKATGIIAVSSTVGYGTTVWISLPKHSH